MSYLWSVITTENAEDTKLFQMATDPDNITLYPGEEPYDLCYYIACNSTQYDQVQIQKIYN